MHFATITQTQFRPAKPAAGGKTRSSESKPVRSTRRGSLLTSRKTRDALLKQRVPPASIVGGGASSPGLSATGARSPGPGSVSSAVPPFKRKPSKTKRKSIQTIESRIADELLGVGPGDSSPMSTLSKRGSSQARRDEFTRLGGRGFTVRSIGGSGGRPARGMPLRIDTRSVPTGGSSTAFGAVPPPLMAPIAMDRHGRAHKSDLSLVDPRLLGFHHHHPHHGYGFPPTAYSYAHVTPGLISRPTERGTVKVGPPGLVGPMSQPSSEVHSSQVRPGMHTIAESLTNTPFSPDVPPPMPMRQVSRASTEPDSQRRGSQRGRAESHGMLVDRTGMKDTSRGLLKRSTEGSEFGTRVLRSRTERAVSRGRSATVDGRSSRASSKAELLSDQMLTLSHRSSRTTSNIEPPMPSIAHEKAQSSMIPADVDFSESESLNSSSSSEKESSDSNSGSNETSSFNIEMSRSVTEKDPTSPPQDSGNMVFVHSPNQNNRDGEQLTSEISSSKTTALTPAVDSTADAVTPAVTVAASASAIAVDPSADGISDHKSERKHSTGDPFLSHNMSYDKMKEMLNRAQDREASPSSSPGVTSGLLSAANASTTESPSDGREADKSAVETATDPLQSDNLSRKSEPAATAERRRSSGNWSKKMRPLSFHRGHSDATSTLLASDESDLDRRSDVSGEYPVPSFEDAKHKIEENSSDGLSRNDSLRRFSMDVLGAIDLEQSLIKPMSIAPKMIAVPSETWTQDTHTANTSLDVSPVFEKRGQSDVSIGTRIDQIKKSENPYLKDLVIGLPTPLSNDPDLPALRLRASEMSIDLDDSSNNDSKDMIKNHRTKKLASRFGASKDEVRRLTIIEENSFSDSDYDDFEDSDFDSYDENEYNGIGSMNNTGRSSMYHRQSLFGRAETPEELRDLNVPIQKRLRHLWIYGRYGIGLWIDMLMISLNILSCLLFIIEVEGYEIHWLEPFFTSIYLVDYMIRVYASKQPMSYVLSMKGIFDFMSFLPGIIDILLSDHHSHFYLFAYGLGFARGLRLARTLRILRYVTFDEQSLLSVQQENSPELLQRDELDEIDDLNDIHRENAFENSVCYRFFRIEKKTLVKISMFTHIMILLYVGAGAFIIIEGPMSPHSETKSFLNAFYFIVCSVTTLGYGDYYPKTGPGKVLILILMGFAFVVLPYRASIWARVHFMLESKQEGDDASVIDEVNFEKLGEDILAENAMAAAGIGPPTTVNDGMALQQYDEDNEEQVLICYDCGMFYTEDDLLLHFDYDEDPVREFNLSPYCLKCNSYSCDTFPNSIFLEKVRVLMLEYLTKNRVRRQSVDYAASVAGGATGDYGYGGGTTGTGGASSVPVYGQMSHAPTVTPAGNVSNALYNGRHAMTPLGVNKVQYNQPTMSRGFPSVPWSVQSDHAVAGAFNDDHIQDVFNLMGGTHPTPNNNQDYSRVPSFGGAESGVQVETPLDTRLANAAINRERNTHPLSFSESPSPFPDQMKVTVTNERDLTMKLKKKKNVMKKTMVNTHKLVGVGASIEMGASVSIEGDDHDEDSSSEPLSSDVSSSRTLTAPMAQASVSPMPDLQTVGMDANEKKVDYPLDRVVSSSPSGGSDTVRELRTPSSTLAFGGHSTGMRILQPTVSALAEHDEQLRKKEHSSLWDLRNDLEPRVKSKPKVQSTVSVPGGFSSLIQSALMDTDESEDRSLSSLRQHFSTSPREDDEIAPLTSPPPVRSHFKGAKEAGLSLDMSLLQRPILSAISKSNPDSSRRKKAKRLSVDSQMSSDRRSGRRHFRSRTRTHQSAALSDHEDGDLDDRGTGELDLKKIFSSVATEAAMKSKSRRRAKARTGSLSVDRTGPGLPGKGTSMVRKKSRRRIRKKKKE